MLSNEDYREFIRREVCTSAVGYKGIISLNIVRNRQISEADRQMLISKMIDLAVEFKAFAHLLVGDKAQIGLALGSTVWPGMETNIAELKEAMDGYEHNSSPAGD